jgi:hypothetical protein
VGDAVEVRTAREILATLDDTGSLAELPFMPEMLQYCGRRLLVSGRADRICNTINYLGSMRLPDAVLLADLRCDGAGHGGCEAECRLFWKEAWLRKMSPGEQTSAPVSIIDDETSAELARRIAARCMRQSSAPDGQPVETYRCQATELVRASERLRPIDPRAYLRVLTKGNVSLGRFVRVMGRAVVLEMMRKLRLMPEVHLAGDEKVRSAEPELGLRPGEWVQIKSKEEIRQTLTPKGKSRGLWFDREMMPFCGKTFRVRRRVTRIIDERNGRMITLKSDCIMLDGVVCSGEKSLGRWFCPRGIFPYWRETWLRRVEYAGDAADRLS